MKCKIMHRCREGDGKFSTRNITHFFFESSFHFLISSGIAIFKTIFQFNFRILIDKLSIYSVYNSFLKSVYVEISIPLLN